MSRLFSFSIAGRVLLLVMSEGALLFACFVAAAFLAPLYEGPEIYLLYEGGLWRIGLIVAVIMLGLYLQDMYEDLRPQTGVLLLNQFCLVLGGTFLIQALMGYGNLDLPLPKWVMVLGSALVLMVAPVWRRAYFSLIRNSLPTLKTIFLGISPAASKLLEFFTSPDFPHIDRTVLGYVDITERPKEANGAPFLGSVEELGLAIERHRPDCIVVAMEERAEHLPIQKLLDLRFSGITVEDVADTYERVFRRVSTYNLEPSQLIFSGHLSPAPWTMALQNVYSYLIALVGMVIALPVMAIVALLVKLTSPGPVLFRQERMGLYGTPFLLYKFRSMRVDAEAITGPVWAQKNDPRVTRVGGWLRRMRLDELPQLFNVLRGEMAIVGPRPERPEFVTLLSEKIPFYTQRHSVKPGITGWAQINHKYGDTIEDTVVKLEYDLYYIKNLTPAFDALIMFHTFKVILLLRGSQ